MAEGHGVGPALVVALDVALQAVLGAEGLLTAVAGAVEGLLSWEGRRRVTNPLKITSVPHAVHTAEKDTQT